jgi:hypothetical protein
MRDDAAVAAAQAERFRAVYLRHAV